MEVLSHVSLFVHIAAGVLTLVAGPIAIFYNFKDVRKHRLAGKVFFYAMLVICITSVFGYLKRPDQVFFQFLLGIAVLVLAGVLRGVRAIRLMRGGTVQPLDYGYTMLLGLFGFWMVGMAGWLAYRGTAVVFPILFAVFGAASLADTWTNWRSFRRAADMQRLDWYRLHVGSMLGAFTASTTAFTVNAAHFLPWYLQWFGPTLLLVPLQIYFSRRIGRARGNNTAAASKS